MYKSLDFFRKKAKNRPDKKRLSLIWSVFDSSHISDPAHETRIALEALQLPCLRGKKIGITAGSRRIANLPVVLGAVGQFLREAGAQPVIIPAMGSHGGASADGQTQLLESYPAGDRLAGNTGCEEAEPA